MYSLGLQLEMSLYIFKIIGKKTKIKDFYFNSVVPTHQIFGNSLARNFMAAICNDGVSAKSYYLAVASINVFCRNNDVFSNSFFLLLYNKIIIESQLGIGLARWTAMYSSTSVQCQW